MTEIRAPGNISLVGLATQPEFLCPGMSSRDRDRGNHFLNTLKNGSKQKVAKNIYMFFIYFIYFYSWPHTHHTDKRLGVLWGHVEFVQKTRGLGKWLVGA